MKIVSNKDGMFWGKVLGVPFSFQIKPGLFRAGPSCYKDFIYFMRDNSGWLIDIFGWRYRYWRRA